MQSKQSFDYHLRRAMAATYVEIEREEMEDFLHDEATRLRGTVVRKQNTAGVYGIALSPYVAIRVSSSVGSQDTAVGAGKGAIRIALVGLQGEFPWKTINGKDSDKTRVNRTGNWRRNAAKMIDAFYKVYVKSKGFYDQLGGDKGPLDTKTLRGIESYPDWPTVDFLSSIHRQVSDGRHLSQRQRDTLERMLRTAPKPKPETEIKPGNDRVLLRDGSKLSVGEMTVRELREATDYHLEINSRDLPEILKQRLRLVYKNLPNERETVLSLVKYVDSRKTLSPAQIRFLYVLENRR